jgi:hypothetical protein
MLFSLGDAIASFQLSSSSADTMPMQGVALTMQTDAMPMQGVALTMQTDVMPMQGVALTMQTDAMPMQGVALTMQTDAMPMQGVALIMQPPASLQNGGDAFAGDCLEFVCHSVGVGRPAEFPVGRPAYALLRQLFDLVLQGGNQVCDRRTDLVTPATDLRLLREVADLATSPRPRSPACPDFVPSDRLR